MASNRVFYACQSVSLGGDTLHGVQSVGINSTFNFEQVFELGQIQIYENIEGVPEVEMTIERVLDGNETLYELMAVQEDNDAGKSLVNVGDAQTTGVLSIFDDSADSAASEQIGVQATGLFVSNYSVNVNLDGPSTESMTLVGNHKAWGTHDAGAVYTAPTPDEPATAVIKRQSLDKTVSKLPQGTDKLQSISVSVDFGREDLQELGEKYPYFRAATYPTEVTCEFTYLADDTFTNSDPGNAHAFYEKDIVGDGGNATDKNKDVTEDEEIVIRLRSINPEDGQIVNNDGYTINLGKKCRLTGIQFGGGDAGGGNATVTYSYSTYNELYSKSGAHTATNP